MIVTIAKFSFTKNLNKLFAAMKNKNGCYSRHKFDSVHIPQMPTQYCDNTLAKQPVFVIIDKTGRKAFNHSTYRR